MFLFISFLNIIIPVLITELDPEKSEGSDLIWIRQSCSYGEQCAGCDPLATPQHIVNKSVVHTEDDKYMIYEIEELKQEDHKVGYYFLQCFGSGNRSESSSIWIQIHGVKIEENY